MVANTTAPPPEKSHKPTELPQEPRNGFLRLFFDLKPTFRSTEKLDFPVGLPWGPEEALGRPRGIHVGARGSPREAPWDSCEAPGRPYGGPVEALWTLPDFPPP